MIAPKEITAVEHYDKLIEVLGKKYVHEKIESSFDFIFLANKGINAAILKNFSVYFDLSKNIMAQLLNVSEPTLYRWTKANKSLDAKFSIRLFEIADLLLYGIEVFGNKDHFFKWLSLPNTALGGFEPQKLIEIPEGVSKVKDVLGRIEHGVYS